MPPRKPTPPTFFEIVIKRIKFPAACLSGDFLLMLLILVFNMVIFLACKAYEVVGASQFFVKKFEQIDELASLIIMSLFVIFTIFTIGMAPFRRESQE
jgi:hypothetical protein